MFKFIKDFYHNFNALEEHLVKLEKVAYTLSDKVDKLELDNKKLRAKIVELFPKPSSNGIENKPLEEIDITEDMRVPLVDGVKVRFETEKETHTITLK